MSIDHLALVGTAVSDAAGRLVSVPLRIALTLAGSALTIVIVRVLITRLVHGIVHGGRLVRTRTRAALQRGQDLPGRTATNALSETRRVQRGKTIGSVLRSTATLVIGAITVVMVLDLLGIPIGPILASAGIAGIALGFGAQTLVKDFLSGLFMLVEDQYGIGDVIDLGEASGTVEAIGLRVTQVRDINGTLWFVRNGEVVRVGNKTQGWSRAVVEVRIDQADDIDRAQALLLKAAQEVADDPSDRSAAAGRAGSRGHRRPHGGGRRAPPHGQGRAVHPVGRGARAARQGAHRAGRRRDLARPAPSRGLRGAPDAGRNRG